MMVVVLSAAVGILLALLRFPAWFLVPVAAFLGADAMLTGIVAGVPTETIALEVLGSIAAPQFAYLGVSVAVELSGLLRWASHVRAAIGRHFGAERPV
jgi:hypothetical protein